MNVQEDKCHLELIAAYVDGDLDSVARDAVERHLGQCVSCAAELRLQRLFMCELDAAFAGTPTVEVPHDFARVVAVQAESDMSGARTGTEGKRALRLCLVLAVASFAMLGLAATESAVSNGQVLGQKLFGLAGLIGRAVYDAGLGFSVMLRVAGGLISPDAFSVLVLLLLLLGILLLLILISGYHRYFRRGLYE